MTILLAFIIGAILGSFLLVAIERGEQGQSWVWARSQCPSCKMDLQPLDLIPLISFIGLRGKCRTCKKPISWRYPLVELLGGAALAVVTAAVIGSQLPLEPMEWLSWGRILLFAIMLLILAIYDWRWQLLPDRLTLPMIAIVAVINFWSGLSWQSLLIGAAVGGGFFLIQFLISRGRWLGGGDIRLGVLLGVMFGWPQMLVAIMSGYIIGAIIGIYLLVTKRRTRGAELPLGLYLAIGALITLAWGASIIDSYMWYAGF
ncbi:MAG: prepilin peptidase [Candidatus Buchananbacteria bacterium]|nr:prepilin peptidase [Candidatus Buchananbacteria bacterium]